MRDASAALDLTFKNPAIYGNLRFTPDQLYYDACRAVKKPKGLNARHAAAVLAASSLPALGVMRRKTSLSIGIFALNAIAASSLVLLRKTPHTLEPPFSFEHFENALDNYLRHQPRPAWLLDNLSDRQVSINSYPRDLTLYGLPRLLVCQSAEIAQMLRANNFHLEASCAVLHLEEAAPLGNVYQKMLVRADGARVFFLHDASFEAYSLLPDLRERLMLPEGVRLQPLGLRPSHAERLHLFVQQGESIENNKLEALTFLSDDEKRWLANGWRAQVAAVSPVRLLRVLRRLVLGLPSTQNAQKISLPQRELGFM